LEWRKNHTVELRSVRNKRTVQTSTIFRPPIHHAPHSRPPPLVKRS
jgi:hypothetical protein